MRILEVAASSARHDFGQLHALVGQIGFRFELGIGRDQIILAVDLDTVACVIDQHDGILALLVRTGGEFLDRLLHQIAGKVESHDDFEAGVIEELRNRLGIVGRIIQRLVAGILRIADHQRDAVLGRGLCQLETVFQRGGADLGVGGTGPQEGGCGSGDGD